jgi:OmcA/MtrC family decaheme c-type cytochrome
VPLLAVLALAASLGLAGCENDGGGSAPPPPDGGGGSGGGGPGPTGPTDPPILNGGPVRNMGTGSTLTAQQIADIGGLITTLDSATITGNKPVIELTVKTAHGGAVLGLAPTTLRMTVAKLIPVSGTLPSRWQSYINRAAAPSITGPALTSAIQANTESGVAAGWQELGAGKYRYTGATDLSKVSSPIAVPYDPSLMHRISIAIDLAGNARPLAPDNPWRDFVPAGGTAPNRLIATTANCDGCHVRFAEHGGPRRTVEYCVTCHNPGSIDPDSGESVDMAYMAHSIHRGENRSKPYIVYGFNGVKFDTSDKTYPQPTSFCETCHVKSAATPQGDEWINFPSPEACGGCHDAGLQKTGPDVATGRYTYFYKHETTQLPPDFLPGEGSCEGCHRAGGVAGDVFAVHKAELERKRIENGDKFTYKILMVENVAVGQSPKVTFQIIGPDGNPVNVKTLTTGRLRLDFSWTPQDTHNVADIAGDAYAANRGQAIVADFSNDKSALVDNGNGTFSYTLPTALPPAFADAKLGTGLMVVLEGRRVYDGADAYPDSAFAFAGGATRPQLVDQAKCEVCHQKVYAHGGSRAGNPIICLSCHNSSVGGRWLVNSVEENFGPLALGAFIHGLHGNQVPAMDPITYPQSLGRCTACHTSEQVYAARPSALPITVDAGTNLSSGADTLKWKDDLADSATAGTCRSCHSTATAISHMTQQGGSFGVAKTLAPSNESCAFCHGPGNLHDTAVAHCNALPFGECKD